MEQICIGLGKTVFNSSACVLKKSDELEIELLLTERLLRKKASGLWPEKALQYISRRHDTSKALIAENRDFLSSPRFEKFLNSQFPFFDHLKSQGLSSFTRHFNEKVHWVPHHLSHAWAATLMSPYEKGIILVVDGAGSPIDDFPDNHPELNEVEIPKWNSKNRPHEEYSVYLMDSGKLRCVKKNWQLFLRSSVPNRWVSEGLGSLYETAASFIFNDKRAAGKVMGLAALGRGNTLSSRSAFIENLDWEKAFTGKEKALWENSKSLPYYSDVAASVQGHFEESLLKLVTELKEKYPEYENLILAGGCALNCTTNMKIFNTGLFKSVYVPPFPGDESIGLGTASYLYHVVQENPWKLRGWDNQHGYFGPVESIPTEENVRKIFSDFNVLRCNSIEKYAAQKLAAGDVIGWYQGRSETGPRALGNRSILACVDKPELKDYLNSSIKMRENFRPYGCSVPHEVADQYFEIPKGFENPFMSFAVKPRTEYAGYLKEVTHFDGTSRMQTVREKQNPRFHSLLKEVAVLKGIPCLLNTSLNVMGEPIVESLVDARNFLLKVPVDGLAIGDYFIKRGTGS